MNQANLHTTFSTTTTTTTRLCATKEQDLAPIEKVQVEQPKTSRNVIKRITRIYVDYAKRLWNETNTTQRQRIAKQKAASAIQRVQHYMRGEEYMDLGLETNEEDPEKRRYARDKLIEACDTVLELESMQSPADDAITAPTASNQSQETKVTKKKSRSVLFGATMGAIVALWVFSGNYIFTGLFTAMTILGQLEYYRMVMNAGVFPARKISVLGACFMFITVCKTSFLKQKSRHDEPHVTNSVPTLRI